MSAATQSIDFDVSATNRRVLDLDSEESDLRAEQRLINVQMGALVARLRVVSVRLDELHLERVELLQDVAAVRRLHRNIMGPNRREKRR